MLKSILEELAAVATAASSSKIDLSNTPHHYQFINTTLGIDLLVKKLNQQTSVCFDTETTSLNALQAELVGIAFSWEVGTGLCLLPN